MGLIYKVNFKIKSAKYIIDEKYKSLLNNNQITENDLKEYSDKYNNVIKEIDIQWMVIK